MRSHVWQVKVSREDIERHVMRIGAREADTIESVDATDLVEEISKWGLDVFVCPGEFFCIPEFLLRLFAIAVHILSEECHFSGSVFHYFSDLSYDLVWITRDLTTTSIGNDTERAIVVTPRLDDHIGTGGILLELADC